MFCGISLFFETRPLGGGGFHKEMPQIVGRKKDIPI